MRRQITRVDADGAAQELERRADVVGTRRVLALTARGRVSRR